MESRSGSIIHCPKKEVNCLKTLRILEYIFLSRYNIARTSFSQIKMDLIPGSVLITLYGNPFYIIEEVIRYLRDIADIRVRWEIETYILEQFLNFHSGFMDRVEAF